MAVVTDEADQRFFEIAERHGLTLRRYIDGEKFVDAKIMAALHEAATTGKPKPDPDTISLIVDACVAIENFLYPDLADKRCDPAVVNTRLLAWIDEFVMEPEAERPAERCTGCTMAELGTCYCNEQNRKVVKPMGDTV